MSSVIDKGVGRRKPSTKRRSTGKPKAKQEPAGPPARGIRRSISASSLSMASNEATKPARKTTLRGLGMKTAADENVVIIDARQERCLLIFVYYEVSLNCISAFCIDGMKTEDG